MVAIEPSPLTEDGLYDKIGGLLVLLAIGTHASRLTMGYAAYENLRFYSDGLSEQAKVIILGAGLTCGGLLIEWPMASLHRHCSSQESLSFCLAYYPGLRPIAEPITRHAAPVLGHGIAEPAQPPEHPLS
jgi:hypothetical protein